MNVKEHEEEEEEDMNGEEHEEEEEGAVSVLWMEQKRAEEFGKERKSERTSERR